MRYNVVKVQSKSRLRLFEVYCREKTLKKQSEILPKIARESLESLSEPLGGLEKPAKALLGSSWETLGRLLGTSRGALGSPQEPFQSVLVASWEPFGASWARIWSPRPVITPLGHDLGSKNCLKTDPRTGKTDFEKISNLVLNLETIFWDT